MKIVATITRAVQTGMDTFTNYSESRVFDTSRSIEDVLNWGRNSGIKNIKMNDILFSEYTGESS